MNPITDTVNFLMQAHWSVYVFWLLLLGSLGLAAVNLLRGPKQRTGAHVWLWLAWLLIGGMWWQQTLWKLPPSFDGLHYWLDQMTQHAAFALQRIFVEQLVQPNFTLFAAMVYAMEVGIAISLMLGFLTRLGGALGALQTLNLWTGLLQLTDRRDHGVRSLDDPAARAGPTPCRAPAPAGSRACCGDDLGRTTGRCAVPNGRRTEVGSVSG